MKLDTADVIIDFLRQIGLSVTESAVPDDTFLPGILVENGGLIIDHDKLKHPGDLLHEAGHLAVVPSVVRAGLTGQVDSDQPMEPVEASAIAWSYAAIKHLGLDPRILFHTYGYLGKAEQLLSGFEIGMYIGVQGLIDTGLARRPNEIDGYPHILRWLAE
jgi:hypothetical protein